MPVSVILFETLSSDCTILYRFPIWMRPDRLLGLLKPLAVVREAARKGAVIRRWVPRGPSPFRCPAFRLFRWLYSSRQEPHRSSVTRNLRQPRVRPNPAGAYHRHSVRAAVKRLGVLISLLGNVGACDTSLRQRRLDAN